MRAEQLLSTLIWSSAHVLKLRTATVSGQAALTRAPISISVSNSKENWIYLPASNLFNITLCSLSSTVTMGMLPRFHCIHCTRGDVRLCTQGWPWTDGSEGILGGDTTLLGSGQSQIWAGQPQKWGPTVACLIMGLKVKSVKNTSHHSQAQMRRASQ